MTVQRSICVDPPTFLEPLKDQVFHLHQNGKLECRVHGIPYPSVQFKKDWRLVAGSHRVKTVREGFDHWTLNIQNCIHMDDGVYECVAENVAGKVYCTATVKVTGMAATYAVSQKTQTVQHKIIRIDFDVVWQKYLNISRGQLMTHSIIMF